jgi:hypothetical protein
MDLQQKIDFFFAPPLPRQPGPQVSTLHLARREAQDCLVDDVHSETSVLGMDLKHRRMFATTGVMSAIDLLAKFHAGADDTGVGGERFKTFLREYVVRETAEPGEFAAAIYKGCRNPLIHSFGLHSRTHTVLLLGDKDGLPVIQRDPGDRTRFLVSVEGLFWQFIVAVGEFEHAVRTTPDLQVRFEPMFDMYGVLTVGQA